MNILAREDIAHFPYKNVIVRALGLAEHLQVDVQRYSFEVGDSYLLCSDGLSDMLQDSEIETILANHEDLGEAAERLIDEANAAGGLDNITVILAQVEDR